MEDLDKVLLKKARWKNMKLHLRIRKNKIKQFTLVYLKEMLS